MRPETFRAHGGWRAAAIGGLLGLMAAPQLFALVPAHPAPGLGARIFGTGGPVTVTIVPGSADTTWEIVLIACGPKDCVDTERIGTNRDSKTLTVLKPIPAEDEILISIHSTTTSDSYQSGPASRNLDNIAHAIVTPKSATKIEVVFEDKFGGGDRDFNDVILEFEGVTVAFPFMGLPITPSDGSGFALNPSGGVDVLPIVAGNGSGVSIPLGGADGWQGTIDFDGSAPNAQLTYTARSAPGLPEVIGRHTTAADGSTDLQLVFPRATGRGTLQVEAFLAGQKVASTQVAPTSDPTLTFSPARILAAKTKVKVKVKKFVKKKDGTIILEGVDIVIETGLTDGEIAGAGNVSFDTLEFSLSDAGFSAAGFSEIAINAVDAPSLTLEDQSVSVFDQLHREIGGAVLVPHDGNLTVGDGFALNASPGVAIDLGNVQSFDLAWEPFTPLGLTLSGSFLELNARGTVKGVSNQDLGTLRVTQLTQADTYAEITADFSAVGSPTQRILVYDQGTLVADVPGHTGAVAQVSSWPTGASKGQAILGPVRLPCYTLPLPEDTCIQILGGPMVHGDQLLVLAENPNAGVESVSGLSLQTFLLPPVTLTGEVATPLPVP